MSPHSPAKLDLSPGSVIHIEGYASGGFAPKNKFLIILGSHNQTTVLAFLLTSNTEYEKTYRARELVPLPGGSIKSLKRDGYIQCFNEVQRLDIATLIAGALKGEVKTIGRLPAFLERIRAVVEASDVLSPSDIADCLRILPAPK